jgi:hypothetical protein
MGQSLFLSSHLRAELRRNSVLYLYQARGAGRLGIPLSYWKSGEELGLVGNIAKDWEAYRKSLFYVRIQLQDKNDELLWAWDDCSGTISAKKLYLALAKKFWPSPVGGWRRHLWKWDLIPKIKLFIWLSLENIILTWDILQRKGWQGPNICVLCLNEAESVYHLFVSYCFCREVWSHFYTTLNIQIVWEGAFLNSFFESWLEKEETFITLPSIICWYLWLERNQVIF